MQRLARMWCKEFRKSGFFEKILAGLRGLGGRVLRTRIGFGSVNWVLQIDTHNPAGRQHDLESPRIGGSRPDLMADLPLDSVAAYDFSWAS